MKTIALVFAFAFVAHLQVCADAPPSPPSENVARIHIYRRDAGQPKIRNVNGQLVPTMAMQPEKEAYPAITVDGVRRGDLTNLGYITVDVPKGKHTVIAVGNTPIWMFSSRTIEQEFEGGKEYFIHLQIYRGPKDGPIINGPNMLSLRFDVRDPKKGKEEILGCSNKTVN